MAGRIEGAMQERATSAPTSALHGAFEVAERWLSLNREALNAINVYPVPDGDTGTNMLLTLRAALQAADTHTEDPAGRYMAILARGALLGARGNSGVILSQMLRGAAEAVDGEEELDGDSIRRALKGAARTAYAAVSNPVEGTMLTVMREAAEALEADDSAGDPLAVIRIASTAAHESVARTPDLLPMLRDAGVVDAGGMGVAVLLTGLSYGFSGERLPAKATEITSKVDLAAMGHEGFGYCTEFLIQADNVDRAALERSLVEAGGDSTLVVGDSQSAHIHVHMADPGVAISLGASLGSLSAVKVENMQAQHEAWAAERTTDREWQSDHDDDASPLPAIGLVAVTEGRGLARAFRQLGARRVVSGEAKPSAADLLAAARNAGTDHVFLLTNDKDVIMAANTAAEHADPPITVIPTRSSATGLAAAVAYMPEGDPEEIETLMTEAIADVHCIEVTRAVRTATVDGVDVRDGDAIAMLDGRLVSRSEQLEDALMTALELTLTPTSSLLTLYLGEGASGADGERLTELIAAAHPQLEVEVLDGGQPHYPYLVSVE